MKSSILTLVATQCLLAICHPYATPTTSTLASQTTVESKPSLEPVYGEFIIQREFNTDGNQVALEARDTTSTSDSATTTTESTSSTTTTTSTSATTDGTTYSDTSATSTSTSSTTTSTTSAQSTTTSAPTTSSSTTTSTSTTTTSTASVTSTASSELAAWNRRGNITAIAFSVCLICLFSGISIAYCARDKAKKRRIAAIKLLRSASTISTEPLVSSKVASSTDFKADRSSQMLKDHPRSETPPRTAQSGCFPLNNDWGQTTVTSSRPATG